MTPKSFSVRIFLQDGHAGGTKIISKSKWSGRGMVIPRSAFAREKDRQELAAAGVYVLVDTQAGAERPILRIGAADPVREQLVEHDVQAERWGAAVIFTCKEDSLNPAQLNYMASSLKRLADDSAINSDSHPGTPPQIGLSSHEKTVADAFLAHMLSLYPLLGVPLVQGRV